jgi:hypothetical protein
MKISGGETAYSRNIKCSNNTGYYNSSIISEEGKNQERKKDKK